MYSVRIMCGIFACLNASPTHTVQSLQAGFDAIRHRGPDHSTLMHIPTTPHIAGFHRLAINDLSAKGNQPLVHPFYPHIQLICNGEIYNHEELAKIYNFKPSSGSDCEIILHMYQRFGIQRTVRELDGYFAFVLFDDQDVYVVRDPIGVRSLYMGFHESRIFIASELKAIHPYCKTAAPFPHGQIWNNQSKTSEPYTTVRHSMHHDEYHTAMQTTRTLLEEAVKKRIRNTERPLGCLLSGGLDSSLITALVCQYSDKPIHTFSIGMSGSTDLFYARMVADALHTIHHEIIVTPEDMIAAIPEVVRQIESYDTTTVRASTPMYVLCKYIATHTDIRVILSGEGSDELSGSYRYFQNAPTPSEFRDETIRLTDHLQFFDVLRCDKSTAAHGLEVRVPFLDQDFLQYYLHIDPTYKFFKNYECEKYLLRDAFRGILPDEALWRKKEAFSDGVSTTQRSWYQIIQDHVATLSLPEVSWKVNPPVLKETLWYRTIFDEAYPNRANILPYYWLPKWCGDVVDPSARVLTV